MLATLARQLGDLDAAEDAVQEAFVEAMRTWPRRGVPDNPGAWITTTARNRALDRARRESRREAKEKAAMQQRPGPIPNRAERPIRSTRRPGRRRSSSRRTISSG